MPAQPEVWLRGPVAGIAPVLQPVAHALMQVAEDLPRAIENLAESDLWLKVGESAPIGFHAVHLCGSLSRLVTYAQGAQLSDDQRKAFVREGNLANQPLTKEELLDLLRGTLDAALQDLRSFKNESLLDAREVGRARLPSTVLGLLFHAAEHTTRHAGQIQTLALVNRK